MKRLQTERRNKFPLYNTSKELGLHTCIFRVIHGYLKRLHLISGPIWAPFNVFSPTLGAKLNVLYVLVGANIS